MKAKKVLFFLLLPLLCDLLISCCKCDDSVTKHYSNDSISLINLDNTGSELIESGAEAIDKDAYGIRINLKLREIASSRLSPGMFITSAYATSCECPPPLEYLPKDSIVSFQVFTINDFDSGHMAGADISAYLKIYFNYNFLPIEESLSRFNSPRYYEEDFNSRIDLLLMTAPTLNVLHQFKVQITLSDGRVLEQLTPETELI